MHRPLRTLSWLIFSFLCLIIIFLGFLPVILSSQFGNEFVTRRLERKWGGSLSIAHLQLSWYDKQEVRQVHYYNPQEGLELEIQQISLGSSLWEFVFNGLYFEDMEILNPSVKYTLSQKGPPSAAVSQPGQKHKKKTLFFPIFGQIKLSDGRFSVEQKQVTSIEFKDTNIAIDIPSKRRIRKIQAFGKTFQNDLSGNFDVNALFSPEEQQYQYTLVFNHFPILGIDSLISTLFPQFQGLATTLLGDSLNLKSKGTYSKAHAEINLFADSPLFNAAIETAYQNNRLLLTKKASIDWKIYPQLFNYLKRFSKMPNLFFSKPILASFTLDQFSLPIDESLLELNALSAKGQVSFGNFDISMGKKDRPINVSNALLVFSTPQLSQSLSSNLSLNTGIQEASGSLQVKLTLEDLLARRNKFNQQGVQSSIRMALQKFPLELVDYVTRGKYYLAQLFGATLDGDFSFKGKGLEGTLAFTSATPFLSISSGSVQLGNQMKLLNPIAFQYRLTPALVENFFQKPDIALTAPTVMQGQIKSLSYSLEKEGSLKMEGSVQCDKIDFRKFLTFDALVLQNLSLDIKNTKMDELDFLGQGTVQFKNAYNPYVELFGPNLAMQLSGQLLKEAQTPVQFPVIQGKLKGERFDGQFEGNIKGVAQQFSLNNPAQMRFLLTTSSFQKWQTKWDLPFSLTKQAELSATAGSFGFSLQNPLKTLMAQINIACNSLSIQPIGYPNPFIFNGNTLQLDYSGTEKNLHLNLAAGSSSDKQNLKADITLAGFENGFFEANKIQGTVGFKQFPSTLLNFYSKKPLQLEILLGPSFNASLKILKEAKQQTNEIALSSQLLKCDMSFAADDKERLVNQSPLTLDWKITPEAYKHLESFWLDQNQKFKPFILKKSARLTATVQTLSLPLSKKAPSNSLRNLFLPKVESSIDQVKLRSLFKLNEFEVAPSSDPNLTAALQQFTIDVKREQLQKPFAYEIKGNVLPRGSIVASGIFQPKEDQRQLECSSSITGFPVIILDALSRMAGMEFPPSALFGESLSASIDTKLTNKTGSIEANIDATNCSASLLGILVNGRMSLHKPLKATITPSEELTRVLFKGMSISNITSRKPIQVYIEDKGFSFPLSPYKPDGVQIPNMLINLDKITCENEGDMRDIGGLFKLKNKGKISLWFAPMDIHVRNGLMDVERTEFLFNNAYQLALWGRILLPQEYVNMTLGLTAQSLESALGMRNLPSGYVLQVPVKGPFGNVKIYAQDASSKIALLIARNAAMQGGGAWGGLFGGLLQGLADDQSSVPPPKPPFPWQIETSQSSILKKPKSKKNYSSLKRSFKEIKQLLKK